MRIAIIARRAQFINGTGGMERAATEIAMGLSRRGHAVELVTSSPTESAVSLPFRVALLPPRQRTGIQGWWDYRHWLRAVAAHVRANPPEFIVSFYGDVAALPAKGPPVLLFTYGLEWFVTPGIHGNGLRRLYGPYGLASIRRAEYLATCGPAHLAHLRRIARAHIRDTTEPVHIHNWKQEGGPSLSRAEARAALGLDEDAVVLGIVSRLARDKRLDIAVRAVQALRAAHPALQLVIAGGGPEQPRLQAAAEGDPGIHVLGRVSDATARAVMAASDATVSIARTQYQLFAVVEALALGVPVLCGYPEDQEGLIRDGLTGFVLPRVDQPALEQAVRRLLATPAETRARMREACLVEVSHGYTLDDALETIEATARRAVEALG